MTAVTPAANLEQHLGSRDLGECQLEEAQLQGKDTVILVIQALQESLEFRPVGLNGFASLLQL
jgi:hypothetical protein